MSEAKTLIVNGEVWDYTKEVPQGATCYYLEDVEAAKAINEHEEIRTLEAGVYNLRNDLVSKYQLDINPGKPTGFITNALYSLTNLASLHDITIKETGKSYLDKLITELQTIYLRGWKLETFRKLNEIVKVYSEDDILALEQRFKEYEAVIEPITEAEDIPLFETQKLKTMTDVQENINKDLPVKVEWGLNSCSSFRGEPWSPGPKRPDYHYEFQAKQQEIREKKDVLRVKLDELRIAAFIMQTQEHDKFTFNNLLIEMELIKSQLDDPSLKEVNDSFIDKLWAQDFTALKINISFLKRLIWNALEKYQNKCNEIDIKRFSELYQLIKNDIPHTINSIKLYDQAADDEMMLRIINYKIHDVLNGVIQTNDPCFKELMWGNGIGNDYLVKYLPYLKDKHGLDKKEKA